MTYKPGDQGASTPRLCASRRSPGATPLGSVAAGVLISLLAGCTSMAPPDATPPLPVPNAWLDVSTRTGSEGRQATELAWEQYFADPLLRQLIATALENNKDLRSAVLRVEEARAAFRIQRSESFPGVGVGGKAARSRVPADLNPPGVPQVGGEYRAEVGLSSWELDLWGRIRSLNRSALESWLATDAAHQAVRIALITQVADGYLGLRELDDRVAIAQQTVASRQESYRIFERRYQVGSTSKLALTQVQTLLNQAKSLQVQLAKQRANQYHALAQLLGSGTDLQWTAKQMPEPADFVALKPGLPSELLASRPDVLSAEHRLRSANANIGAARAAFFPRIALTGTWGTASSQLNDLFESGSRAWTFVPTVSLPIFDGGQRRASLELSEVRRDMAITSYEQTVQIAFREVADALSDQRWLADELSIASTSLDVQRERARLAQLLYDNGSAAYLEVLDAQRDLLDAQQSLIQARRSFLSSQVALYAALGGGADIESRSMPVHPARAETPSSIR